MKDNYTEKLSGIYPEVPEKFHEAVRNALENLDTGKTVSFSRRRSFAKKAAVCAAAAALAAFSVTAGATGFFGLFSEQKEAFGLHVGVEQSKESPEEKHVKIVASYIPKGFELTSDSPTFQMYEYGKEVYENREKTFTITATDERYYDETYTNVINSNEETVNKRRVVYMTFRYGENNDTLKYGAAVHFRDEGYVVYVNNTDKEELEKIVSGLSLADDTEYESRIIAGVRDEEKLDIYGTPFDEKLRKADRSFTVSVNERVEKDGRTVSDNSANLTIGIRDVHELTTDEGLDRNNFPHETGRGGREYNLHVQYFNSDGTLKSDYVRERYLNTGDNVYDTLGRVERTDMTRHFYMVTLEISSDADMQNLRNIISPFGAVRSVGEDDDFFYESDGIYWGHSIYTGNAAKIYIDGV